MTIIDSQSADNIAGIVLKLGGSHMEMSFLGCIGHLMAGSGLKDVLEVVYASNVVEEILTGKSVLRAVLVLL